MRPARLTETESEHIFRERGVVVLLQILGCLLKLIGLLLLGILCLLLVLLLLVLFVPLRYRARVEKAEQLAVTARIGWLSWLVAIRITFRSEQGLQYRLRIFGIPVLDSERAKREKTPKQLERAARKAEKAAAREAERAEQQGETEKAAVGEAKRAEQQGEAEEAAVGEVKQTERQGEANKNIAQEPVADRAENNELPIKEAQAALETETDADAEDTGDKETTAQGTIFSRICAKVRSFFSAIGAKLRAFVDKLRHLRETLRGILEKIKTISSFLGDTRNKDALRGLGRAGKQLFCYILPTYITGTVVFGTGDPCSTGKAMAALGMAFPIYGKRVSITPDFLEKRIEADVFLKGRIRMGRLLFIGLRVVLSRWFRQFLKRVKALRTALS